MTTSGQSYFGPLLQQARKAAGLNRGELAQRVDLNVSYIYRIEVGDRCPSREAVLALAEALRVDDTATNEWLLTAGYAPLPLLTTVRAAVRTRGGRRRPRMGANPSSPWDTARWATWLEATGLEQVTIGRLLQAMETARLTERQEAVKAVRATFTRIAEMLEAPVHTAVIPAAGGQHQLLASHVMQRMLLRTIGEATASGIINIVLILPPGMRGPLYEPLQEALSLAVVPCIALHYTEQTSPDGLGDAILQAEELVGHAPFAVLLPDDVIRGRIGRTASPRELHSMMLAMKQLGDASLIAVASVLKSKMPHCGVAQLHTQELLSRIRPVERLVEKPRPNDAICESSQAYGIVGRYLLQPSIFASLRELKKSGQRPVHLTDALQHLRQAGQDIFGFELEAKRADLGEVLDQASELLGDGPELSIGS